MIRITYKHWKKPDKILVVEGELPQNLNRQTTNDRYIVKCTDGGWEDVLKSTIIKMEELPD
jgi:hypothetical protein